MPSAHIQKEETAQTEESSPNNCSVLCNNDGEQTEHTPRSHGNEVWWKDWWQMKLLEACQPTWTQWSVCWHQHAGGMLKCGCTRHLLRAQVMRAHAGGRNGCFTGRQSVLFLLRCRLDINSSRLEYSISFCSCRRKWRHLRNPPCARCVHTHAFLHLENFFKFERNPHTPFCSIVVTGERFDYVWTCVQTCPRLHTND